MQFSGYFSVLIKIAEIDSFFNQYFEINFILNIPYLEKINFWNIKRFPIMGNFQNIFV